MHGTVSLTFYQTKRYSLNAVACHLSDDLCSFKPQKCSNCHSVTIVYAENLLSLPGPWTAKITPPTSPFYCLLSFPTESVQQWRLRTGVLLNADWHLKSQSAWTAVSTLQLQQQHQCICNSSFNMWNSICIFINKKVCMSENRNTQLRSEVKYSEVIANGGRLRSDVSTTATLSTWWENSSGSSWHPNVSFQ